MKTKRSVMNGETLSASNASLSKTLRAFAWHGNLKYQIKIDLPTKPMAVMVLKALNRLKICRITKTNFDYQDSEVTIKKYIEEQKGR